MAVCVQWAWLVVTQIIPLIASSDAKEFFIPSSQNLPAATPVTQMPDTLQILLIVVAVLFSVSVSLYAIFLVPKTIAQAGKTVTKAGAKAATNQLSKGKNYTSADKRRLRLRFSWAIKFLLVAVPMLVLAIPVRDEIGLSSLQVMLAGLLLGLISSLWFTLQAALTAVYKLPAKDVW